MARGASASKTEERGPTIWRRGGSAREGIPRQTIADAGLGHSANHMTTWPRTLHSADSLAEENGGKLKRKPRLPSFTFFSFSFFTFPEELANPAPLDAALKRENSLRSNDIRPRFAYLQLFKVIQDDDESLIHLQ